MTIPEPDFLTVAVTCPVCGTPFNPLTDHNGRPYAPGRLYCSRNCTRKAANRIPRDVDEIAVERACKGDLGVTLNRAETLAAFCELEGRGYSAREIARRLGVTPRTVVRWRNEHVALPFLRYGKASTERKTA